MAARASAPRFRILQALAAFSTACLVVTAPQARTRRHARPLSRAAADSLAQAESLAALPGTQALETAITRIAQAAGGTVGVAAVHVETGERVSLHGSERFPMASVFKLPIAMQVLHRVDQGQVSLDSTLRVTASDLRQERTPLAYRFRHRRPGTTLGELLELALERSDNTASDILLRVAGGPPAVNARLRALGVKGIRVDRPEAEMSLDYHGVTDPPPPEEWTRAAFAELLGEVPRAEQDSAAAAFLRDPRDTATPDATADLLVCVLRGETLSDSSTALLLDMMTSAVTGPHRLKWRLPPGTPVAHKTGTWGTAAVNDVGLITLPGEAGHVAIAVFVKGSTRGESRIEHTIGRIARAAYDHWTPPADAVAEPSLPKTAPVATKHGSVGSGDR